MSSVPKSRHDVRLTADPRVSSYDRTAAFLVACVTVIGFLVFILFLIWLTMVVDSARSTSVQMVEDLAGNDNRPEGIADDWQEPGVEDFPEVEQPQIANALEAVTDAVSAVQAQLEKYDGDAAQMGRGPGLGDRRQRGPGSGTGNIVPPWERWRIEYAASTSPEYMSILESFDITLGGVHQVGNRIDYVDNLTANQPATSQGLRKDEKRLYFHNQKNRLRRWDSAKVASAGIDMENIIVVQFYPPAVIDTLTRLEQEAYQKDAKTLPEVKQTLFRVRPAGSGFEYFVQDITYRPAPR